MGHPAQAGFDPANDNGGVFIGFADQISVNHRGMIRALAHNTAGSVGVHTSSLLGYRIVIDTAVHISGTDQKAKLRLP